MVIADRAMVANIGSFIFARIERNNALVESLMFGLRLDIKTQGNEYALYTAQECGVEIPLSMFS